MTERPSWDVAGVPIGRVVQEIGKRLARREEEIERAARLLDDHWIGTVEDWRLLSPELRRDVGLPLVLASSLDELSQQPPEKREPALRPSEPTAQRNQLGHLGEGPLGVAQSSKAYPLAYCLDLGPTVCCEIERRLLEFEPSDPLAKLLKQLGRDAHLTDVQWAQEIHPSTPIKYALVHGRELSLSRHRRYMLKTHDSSRAVDGWLASMGMERHRTRFEHHGIDDFLVLPYLRLNVLEDMGIAPVADRNVIMSAVKGLQDLSEARFVGLWLRFLGLDLYEEIFSKNEVGLRTISLLKESDFVRLGLNPTRTALFFHATKYYREFSSAEATFTWLRWKGLGRYAYQFARYQVPFYALPLVNFFIIDEMGVTNQDKALLSALQTLKHSPAYAVKAMAYWLLDLELEEYSLVFSKSLMVDFIESLTILNDHTINSLISCNTAREKMKIAVREMKEVQFYYSASVSLLQDLVLQKYADVFANHNISIDNLPLLDDAGLLEMGFVDQADRKAILASVKKIKAELPSGALRLFYSNEPNLYQIDHKESASLMTTSSPPLDCGRSSRASAHPHHCNHGHHRPEDTRSVEELISFINGGSSSIASPKHQLTGTTQFPTGGHSLARAPYNIGSNPSTLLGTCLASPLPALPYSIPTSTTIDSSSRQPANTSKKAKKRARRKLSLPPPSTLDSATTVKTIGDGTMGSEVRAEVGNVGNLPPVKVASKARGSPQNKINDDSKRLEDEKVENNALTKQEPSASSSLPEKGRDTLLRTQRHRAKNNRTTQNKKMKRMVENDTSKGEPAISAVPKRTERNPNQAAHKDMQSWDDALDPALEAQIDREVEEFRLRLESHSASLDTTRRRPIPSSLHATLTQFNAHQLKLRSAE